MLSQRVATSELYRASSPTDVRVRWAFSDFLGALLILDVADEARARAEAEAQESASG